MVDIEQLKKEEMESLMEKEEVYDLEELVLGGVDARFPVMIKFPTENEDGTIEMKKAGALLRPLTNIEWNNAVRIGESSNKTTQFVELLKMALYRKNGEQMPAEIIMQIPNGIVTELVTLLAEVSGVDIEKSLRQARMMGFSV